MEATIVTAHDKINASAIAERLRVAYANLKEATQNAFLKADSAASMARSVEAAQNEIIYEIRRGPQGDGRE